MQQNDLVEKLSVRADSLDEAVEFVVSELQSIASSRGARGFLVPVLTRESIELLDGGWAHVFEFSADLLPGGT